MAIYNKEKYVGQAIDSIINQSIGFRKNIQLILVNDKSSDGTLKILEKYQEKYSENIILITNDINSGPAFSRNQGLAHVKGKYVNFIDSDDYISTDAFKLAYEFLEKHAEIDIVSIPIKYFGVKRGYHNLNYKFEKDQVVSVLEKPNHIQLSGASSFFRYEKLKNYHFNDKLRISEDALLINQMLLDNPNIGFLSIPTYFYRKDGSQNSLITSSANSKSYFTTRIDEYFFKLIESAKKINDNIPKFIQYVLMYDLQWIVEIRKVDHLLNPDEINVLYDKLTELVTYIDEDVILNQVAIPAALKAHVLSVKRHGKEYVSDKTKTVDNFKLNTIFIDNFEFKSESELYISGMLTDFTKDTQITAVVDGEEIPTEILDYPQRDNYSLNFNYGFNHNFKVTLNYNENSKITFKSQKTDLKIDYAQTSRLNKISGFKLSKNHFAIAGDNEICIIKKTISKGLKLEFGTIKNMLKTKTQGWRTGWLIRLLYLLIYPFYRNKRFWIFMDLPTVAGDNGLELFKYVNSIDSDVKSYFVLEKSHQEEYDYLVSSKFSKIKRLLGFGAESEQFREIKKIGNVLAYRSLKHRIFTLFAQYIVTSHPDNTIIYPFWGNYTHISGLAKSKTVFLQHGVTKDNVSEWLNEFDKPLSMLVATSNREKESFNHPNYGYYPQTIKTLGFPRFDRLDDDSRKEIVFMPSWRRNLDQLSTNEFMKSEFYKSYNSLLTDTDFIDFLVENGYELKFKPHRNLYKFISTFAKHPNVEFDLNQANYNETFKRASLIITDYSSVSFDFAYMKKPLVYYQFGNDYHFDVESAYFQYERDGFGPVCRNHEDLKRQITKIIENGCVMDEVYQKRVEEFFKYIDKNNSKRVYEEILNLDYYY